MNMHENARLTPAGRALMVRRIMDEGWRILDAARAAGVSERTAREWLGRYRRGAPMTDRSSAPHRCPHALPAERLGEIEQLRRQRLTGPQIAARLGMARSTVGAILQRLGLGRLAALDPKPPSSATSEKGPAR